VSSEDQFMITDALDELQKVDSAPHESVNALFFASPA